MLEASLSENAHAVAGHHDHGEMDIHEQKGTFHHFLLFALWGTVLLIQSVGLLTFAFAVGLGWWAGLAVYVAVGVGAGLFAKMGGAWWATLIASTVLLGIGGLIISLVL